MTLGHRAAGGPMAEERRLPDASTTGNAWDGPREGVHLDLARELVGRGGTWTYVETSWSMTPAISPGDRVTVGPCPVEELGPGDVAALLLDGRRLLVHRVLWVGRWGPRWWVFTKGDARSEPDPPSPGQWLLGVVVRVQGPDGADRAPGRPRWQALRSLGRWAWAAVRRRVR